MCCEYSLGSEIDDNPNPQELDSEYDFWQTKDKKLIPIKDMTDLHLINCMIMLEDIYKDKVKYLHIYNRFIVEKQKRIKNDY